MRYLSGYYWRQNEQNDSFLVLFQAYYKKNRVPVLFAGIGEGKTMAERCSDWFYETGLPLCGTSGWYGNSTYKWKKAVKSLSRFLQKESEGGSFCGIFCVGERIVWFGRGQGELLLLNQRGRRSQCYHLKQQKDRVEQDSSYGNGDGCYIKQGIMQCGIGILLTTKGFTAHLAEDVLAEMLNVRELITRSEEQLSVILSAVGSKGNQEKGIAAGAVLLCVEEEK